MFSGVSVEPVTRAPADTTAPGKVDIETGPAVSGDGAGRFRALAERSSDLLLLVGTDRLVLWANAACERVLGYPVESLVGTDPLSLVHPDDLPRLLSTIGSVVTLPGATGAVDYRLRAADGTWHSFDTSATNLGDDPDIAGIVISMRDVTAQRHAEAALAASEESYRDLVEHASDAVVVADMAGNITFANRSMEQLLGFAGEELAEMNMFDPIAPEDLERAQQTFARHGENIDLHLLTKGGGRVFVEVTARYAPGPDGEPARIQAILRDRTEQRRLQDQLSHQVFHDALTGLPNRLLFGDRLDQALARARHDHGRRAVMILDLDGFKAVNESLGHEVGDELLRMLAPALRAALRPEDTVARLGGDEFGFLIEEIRDDHACVAAAEQILAALAVPAPAPGTPRISGSLGIAITTPGATGSDLLRAADTALYEAKARNPGGYEFYDAPMRARVVRELDIRTALAEAVENDQLTLHYQPIVALDDERLLGVEALIRWQHPQWGWVQPSEFIPIAEATGLIVPVGLHVIAAAAEQAAAWRRLYPHALPWGVAINLSPLELSQNDFLETLQRALAEHETRPHDLTVEVTERTFIDEHNETLGRNIEGLDELGIRLSLDDFGTGYASLASLQRFPFTTLKIDRRFARRLTPDTPHAPMTRASIQLAHSLDMHVVAEGVETEFQASHLRRLDCDAAQGYYFARPQPAANIAALLQPVAGVVARTLRSPDRPIPPSPGADRGKGMRQPPSVVAP